MSVLAGAQAPEHFDLAIENAEAATEPLDLTTVTDVSLQVVTPSGARKTWDATIEDQEESLLVVSHIYDVNDIQIPGRYSIVAIMAVPGGVRRAGPTALEVV